MHAAAKDAWAAAELGLPVNKVDGSGQNVAGQYDQDRDKVTTTKKGKTSTTVGEDADDANAAVGAVPPTP